MPRLSQKELNRFEQRLNYLYVQLGGESKERKKSKDEFTNLQDEISEQLIFIRKLIKKREKLHKREDFIKRKKNEQQIQQNLSQIQSNYKQMKNILQNLSKKTPEQVKNNKKKVLESLGKIIDQIKQSISNQETDVEIQRVNRGQRLNLEEIQQKNPSSKTKFINFEENNDVTDEEENTKIQEWQQKDEQLDEKIGDIINILDEIKIMNKNLSHEIGIRHNLILENKEEATKLNEVLDRQNKSLADVLNKMRKPQRLCLDCCMCLLIVGLIGVIIMLIKNGKQLLLNNNLLKLV